MHINRLLILSDGKPGHLNQSIAFARQLGYDFDVCQVSFRSRLAKAVSYLADRFRVRSKRLVSCDPVAGEYHAVVSAGSETYYANRVLSRQLQARSVAIMLPKGYRYDFDLIVAQQHDDPPPLKNIVCLPINLTFVEPPGLVVPESANKYAAVVVGGSSKRGELDAELLRKQLEQLFELLPEHRFWLTTSRRTPEPVERMLSEFSWERAVYFSREKINPIPDFLAHSDYLFLTADSTSMISEAVSYGKAYVEVLPPVGGLQMNSKTGRMVIALQQLNCLQLFNGRLGVANHKIELKSLLNEVVL